MYVIFCEFSCVGLGILDDNIVRFMGYDVCKFFLCLCKYISIKWVVVNFFLVYCVLWCYYGVCIYGYWGVYVWSGFIWIFCDGGIGMCCGMVLRLRYFCFFFN